MWNPHTNNKNPWICVQPNKLLQENKPMFWWNPLSWPEPGGLNKEQRSSDGWKLTSTSTNSDGSNVSLLCNWLQGQFTAWHRSAWKYLEVLMKRLLLWKNSFLMAAQVWRTYSSAVRSFSKGQIKLCSWSWLCINSIYERVKSVLWSFPMSGQKKTGNLQGPSQTDQCGLTTDKWSRSQQSTFKQGTNHSKASTGHKGWA